MRGKAAGDAVSSVWCQLLGMDSVLPSDDFFALGGNSLLALRAAAMLGSALNVIVQPAELFGNSNVAQLAQRLSTLKPLEEEGLSGSDGASWFADVKPVTLCSPTQSFFLYFSAPQDDAWMNHDCYTLVGCAFDQDVFKDAVNTVVQRHGTLRTIFHLRGESSCFQPEHRDGDEKKEDGAHPSAMSAASEREAPGANIGCEQEILDMDVAARFVYQYCDVSTAFPTEAGARAEAQRLAKAGAMRNVDVTARPLFRTRVFKVSGNESLLSIEAHHVVVDGGSWSLLFSELSLAYAALLERKEEASAGGAAEAAAAGASTGEEEAIPATPPVTLARLPCTFSEWSATRLRELITPETRAAMRRVVDQLRGYEDRGTTMPTTYPRDLSDGWHLRVCTQVERITIASPAALALLRRTADTAGCTYFAAVVAVFHAWQHALTGKRRVALMASTTWRDSQSESLIGCFLSDSVLVADLAAGGGGGDDDGRRAGSGGAGRTQHGAPDSSAPAPASAAAAAVAAAAALPPVQKQGAAADACTFAELVHRVTKCHTSMTRHTASAPLAAWNAVFDAPPLPYVILLNWIPDEGDVELELPGVEATWQEPLEQQVETPCAAESELDIEFEEETGEMTWRFNTSLYDEAAIDSMLAAFDELLEHCAANPQLPIPAPRCDAPYTGWLATALPPPNAADDAIERWQSRVGDAL